MPTSLTSSRVPLPAPTQSGNFITVDRWLNSPTLITRSVQDMMVASDDFFIDRIFSRIGTIQGGSVVFSPVEANSLYSDRPVEEVEPGEEFPILSSSRGEPKIARVKKFGGQIWISDEAREDNLQYVWDREQQKLVNTMALQLNTVGVAVLNAAIADTDAQTGGSRTATSISWTAARGLTPQTTAPSALPQATFAAVKRRAYAERQGMKFDTLILNQQEDESLDLVYADRLDAMLARYGITSKFVTDQQAAGKVKFVASGQVGVWGLAGGGVKTETWRTPGLERTDVKTSERPVFAADNRWAIQEVTV